MIGIDFIDKGISTIKQTVAASFLRVEHIQLLFWQKDLQRSLLTWQNGKFCKVRIDCSLIPTIYSGSYSYSFTTSIVRQDNYSEYFNLKKHRQGGFKTPY